VRRSPSAPDVAADSTPRVESLWRYPVKSMQGEALDELTLEENGVTGDRSFGILDLATGTIVSAKREGRLLEASARLSGAKLRVRLTDDEELGPGASLDETLTAWLGRPVRLADAENFEVATFEGPEDYERDDSPLVQWAGREGSFVDESPLHLLTTSDLALLATERADLQWDVRRFRPNVVVNAETQSLGVLAAGCRLRIGGAEIQVSKGCTRCVMTTRSQPNGLERQLEILRHLVGSHANQVGVRARVVRPGVVRVGDPVQRIE